MNVSEKVLRLQNGSPGVPRLGLPAYQWWSEALHGVAGSPGVSFARSGDFSCATSFPEPIGLGATFDRQLIRAIAGITSQEARAFNNAERAGLDFWTPNSQCPAPIISSPSIQHLPLVPRASHSCSVGVCWCAQSISSVIPGGAVGRRRRERILTCPVSTCTTSSEAIKRAKTPAIIRSSRTVNSQRPITTQQHDTRHPL